MMYQSTQLEPEYEDFSPGLEAFSSNTPLHPGLTISRNFTIYSDIKGLIVDFDGTLAHTYRAHTEPFRKIFESYINQQIDEKEWLSIYHSCAGQPELLTCEALINRVEAEYQVSLSLTAEELRDLRNDYVKENVADLEITLSSALISCLRAFKESDNKVILCTASSSGFVKPILEHFELLDIFDEIVTAEVFSPEEIKPAPNQHEKAIEVSGYAKNELLVLEDSLTGMAGALQAGLEVVVTPPECLRDVFFEKIDSKIIETGIADNSDSHCYILTDWSNLFLGD